MGIDVYRVPARKYFLVPMGTGYQPDKKFWEKMGTGDQPDKNFWVPMGTGYQPEKYFWVPMGTGYRLENFFWVPPTPDPNKKPPGNFTPNGLYRDHSSP